VSAKILLVQHNHSLRQARSLIFGGAFFHALSLREASQVRDYLARETVDVILADCRGADASGLDFIESLRKVRSLTIVSIFVRPCVSGLQNFGGNPRA